MLPSYLRLSKKIDFDMVFKHGRSKALRCFFIRWRENQLHHPRIGIIVSNKVSKKATERNTLKRRIREILWKVHREIGDTDIIIIAKQGSVNTPYKDIERDMRNISQSIKK